MTALTPIVAMRLELLRTPAFALPMFVLPVALYLLLAFAVMGEQAAKTLTPPASCSLASR